MTQRRRLLFHCQHSLGLGHLVRSYVLAQELGREFDVTLVRGGEAPAGIRAPDGVDIVQLPALSANVDGGLRASSGDVSGLIAQRRDMLLERLEALEPAALVVELFPFGRKKLTPELLPLLEAARSSNCRVVCSVRDLLVDRGADQVDHDERAGLILNAFFDAVLVHADPAFARLDDSFHPRTPIRIPVHHTGFVAPAWSVERDGADRSNVVVSAGGGAYGEELLSTAIRARRFLADGLDLRVIAGPFVGDETWERLRRAADDVEGVELVRQVPALECELARASASLSQCGYNTALALLQTRVPALVVPFSEGRENEQTRRAERLEALGAVRVLRADELEPRRLARELTTLRTFRPQPVALRLDGARESARAIAGLVRSKRAHAAPRSWLEPLRRALAERESPVSFFFRDDDAGWGTDSLWLLLDLFASHGVPLDLAAIPSAVDAGLAGELTERADAGAAIRVHQHGWAHTNHQAEGRKSEFGTARAHASQRADIAAGRRRLRELLEPLVDPIFTPPWNRCTGTTACCLNELGFAALSREVRAQPLELGKLVELPVTVDWFGRSGTPTTKSEVAFAAATAVSSDRPVGVMLHHAELDDDARRDTGALLALLRSEAAAELRPMRAIARSEEPAPS